MTNGKAAATTAIAAAIAISACMGIFLYSFARTIDFGDEGSSIYLLAHASSSMASMDHFVWGHLFGALGFNVVELRWANLVLLVGSNALLCAACVSSLYKDGWERHDHLIAAVVTLSFSTLGTLLFFTVASVINYNSTLVIAANIFSSFAIFSRRSSARGRLLFGIGMGFMTAFAFMARASGAVLFLIYFVIFSLLLDRDRSFSSLLVSLATIIAAALSALLIAIFLGYGIGDQLTLLRALSQASHSPLDLLRAYVPTGVAVLMSAAIATGLYVVIERRLGKPQGRGMGTILMLVLPMVVTVALGYMAYAGFFIATSPRANPLDANNLLSSLAPGIHAGTLSLLFIVSGPQLSGRFPILRSWFTPESDHSTRILLRYAVVLYCLCLFPQVGTDSGILNRCVGLGAVFLVLALLLLEVFRKGGIAAWMLPVVIFWVALPVVSDLYAKLINHSRVNGSAFDQTVILDHPRILEGLRVTPVIADFQGSIERELRRQNFDFNHDVIMPATRQLGVLALIGATNFSIGGVFRGYKRIEIWNCALIKWGLQRNYARIFVFDYELLDDASKSCLTGYDVGPPVSIDGIMSVRVLSKRL